LMKLRCRSKVLVLSKNVALVDAYMVWVSLILRGS